MEARIVSIGVLITVISYIRREQDYRKTIDEIHAEIAKRSSDPFGFLSQNVAAQSIKEENIEQEDADNQGKYDKDNSTLRISQRE